MECCNFAMTEHYSRIFLLSHMRACTSLAGHILGSHPAINGYFELHISYEDEAALDRQLEVFRQYETLKEGSHYLFDKLLHNDYRLNINRSVDVDIKVLVSLLEPEQTIKSIVDLFQKKGSEDLYASPLGATNYYIDRVNWLAGFCRSSGLPYYYYDAELFQAAPQALLEKLTEWLRLDTPLSERYQLFSQTGKAGKGDSSALIYSGKIEQARVDYSHIHIPDDALRRAREAYRDCRALMLAHAADCLVMPGGVVRAR
jgi:hypothetical protein